MVGRIAAATVLAGLSVTVATSSASAVPLSSESFAGARISSSGWVIGSPRGADSPCATAATATVAGFLPACREVVDGRAKADPDGGGAFRLTGNSGFNAGSLLLDKPIKAERGVRFEFDMYQYKGKPTTGKFGADGIAFWIVDGAETKVDAGEGLGYKGLSGAFVGIGFDVFGNFSGTPGTPGTPGGPGGPGLKPNSVAVRGSAAAGYDYISGKSLDPATHPLAIDAATRRADAKRHVTVDINSSNVMNVRIDFNDGKGPTPVVTDLDLDKLPRQEPLPKTLKVGWAAATGNAAAVHEIGGFSARTLDADLKLTVTDNGPWQGGRTGAYHLDVAVNPSLGWSDDPVKLSWSVPAGVTPTAASGDGWACTIAGRVVSCTSVTHIAPGAHYPPVRVDVALGTSVSGNAVATGGIEAGHDKVTSTVSVKPAAIKPVLGKAVVKISSHPNPYVAGDKFTYTASAANPGPGAMNDATIAVTWPPAFKPLKWKCTATGGAVCPAADGTGDIDTTVDLPAGGALTYTQVSTMPVGVITSFTASVAVVAPGSGCTADKPCVAAETNRPPLY
ncbi:lectin-like domain-containing protein [Acrocarpospora macrocephala]|uniref:lectin-like domain-containing protein n=1 Tax=Acrocarpospora macrocephala TaxID=150177 RepID=UPI0012D2DA4D|nr:hypothetical protein [Acrocarpospora macrocephala]